MYISNMVQSKSGSIFYKTKQNKRRPKEEWIRVENTHEPIIDIELWNKVQSLIKQRAKPFKNGEIGIFAAKVKCMYYGRIMRNTSGRNYRYLKCSTHRLCKDACVVSFIATHTLEEYILNLINKKLEYQIKSKEKDIDVLQTAINNSYLDKIQGVITEQDFINFKNNFTDRQKSCLAMINSAKDEIKLLKVKMNSQNDIDRLYNTYSHITKLDSDIVNTLIDYIEVGKRDSLTREIHINIHWKF